MTALRFTVLIAASYLAATAAHADGTYQTLPFVQNWSNTALIVSNDNWGSCPGIMGYRGDNLTTATGSDPQTILGTSSVVDVNANQTNPNTFNTSGVTEFHLTDPVVALQGSGTADAPYVQLHVTTAGMQNIVVAYDLRDIDGSNRNAVQSVALQYRVGTSGNFVNVPSAYVADATTGPSLATLVTPVNVLMPSAINDKAQVQIRILTSNAANGDEWVGVDNLSVTGSAIAVAAEAAAWSAVKSQYR